MGSSDDSSSSLSEDEVFVVEKILDRKKKGSKWMYLLKWEGYTETTWEPEENIIDKEMVLEFNKSIDDGAKKGAHSNYSSMDLGSCDICQKSRGHLVQCDSCSVSRHKNCINDELLVNSVEDQGEETIFICEFCRIDQIKCHLCENRFENLSGIRLFRCIDCHRSFHTECNSDNTNGSLEKQCYECFYYGENVEEILTSRKGDQSNSEDEYLVKFQNWSFRKCFWIPESWLNWKNSIKLNRFKKEDPIPLADEDVVQVDWCHVDRILHEKTSDSSPARYLIKWRGLGFDQVTWEDANSAGYFVMFGSITIPQNEFDRALKAYHKSLKINRHWSPKTGNEVPFSKIEEEDVPLVGGKLMEYQLEGANWMLYNWHKGLNCLLADEMGLGKTVQTICLLEHLRMNYGSFPVLILAPSSVCQNWIDEFNRWAPKISHVLYGGSVEARDNLIKYELFNRDLEKPNNLKKERLIKNHVVVTSYAILTRDRNMLKNVPWQAIVVDEAHRLKGTNNQLSDVLEDFRAEFRLLLTGTPLQNNLGELFKILSFLDPENFADHEEMGKSFDNLGEDGSKLDELHSLLRPRILRRTKKDVGLDSMIPPRKEIIVPVSMSNQQVAIYKSILQKNYSALAKLQGSASKCNLVNILMELRKCVNHPYLVVDEPDLKTDEETIDAMVKISGKLELLSKMLEKMFDQGHRVLIFSQMTRMLDILEDYLALKNYKYSRLDGQTPVEERQTLVSSFNDPKSDVFVCLLSTRAGGLGINLTSADTIILYDHDYNPHNDLQALCRAHRIGQKKRLFVYRLVTLNSVEESIVEVAKGKLLLDHIVVESMNKPNMKQLESLLKTGLGKLFSEESPQRLEYDEVAIESLLERNAGIDSPMSSSDSLDKNVDNQSRVSIFNEEVFSNARVWEDDEDAWKKLIPEAKDSPIKQLGKGMRNRRNIKFYDTPDLLVEEGSDYKPEYSSESSDSENEDLANIGGNPFNLEHQAVATKENENMDSSKIIKSPHLEVFSASSLPKPNQAPNSQLNSHLSCANVKGLLENAYPIILDHTRLSFLVEKTPLLNASQRLMVMNALSTFTYQPLLMPDPTFAAEKNAVFGLLQTARDGVLGVFCVMFLKDSKRSLTFFVPATQIPSMYQQAIPPQITKQPPVNKIFIPRITSVGVAPSIIQNVSINVKNSATFMTKPSEQFSIGSDPKPSKQLSVGGEYFKKTTIKLTPPVEPKLKAMSISSVVTSPGSSLVETRNTVIDSSKSGSNDYCSAVEALEKEDFVVLHVKAPRTGNLELQAKIEPKQVTHGTTFMDKNNLLDIAMSKVQTAKMTSAPLKHSIEENNYMAEPKKESHPSPKRTKTESSSVVKDSSSEQFGMNRIMEEMIALRRENELLRQQVKLLTSKRRESVESVATPKIEAQRPAAKIEAQRPALKSEALRPASKIETQRSTPKTTVPVRTVSKPINVITPKPKTTEESIANKGSNYVYSCKWKTCAKNSEGFETRSELWKHVYSSHIHQH